MVCGSGQPDKSISQFYHFKCWGTEHSDMLSSVMSETTVSVFTNVSSLNPNANVFVPTCLDYIHRLNPGARTFVPVFNHSGNCSNARICSLNPLAYTYIPSNNYVLPLRQFSPNPSGSGGVLNVKTNELNAIPKVTIKNIKYSYPNNF